MISGASAIVAGLLAGCATNGVPSGYTGPVGRIADSFADSAGGGVDFFFVDKIDGRSIHNALEWTLHENAGRGFSMDPVPFARDVPAQAATFTITGRTQYAAPILELTKKVYQVSGEVNFTPAPGRLYTVKGVLSAAGSSVWIEDDAGRVVDRKVEREKSALGLLQK